MIFQDLLYWAGLLAVSVGFIGLGIIGLRHSAWFGKPRPLLSGLDPVEIRILAGSVLFVAAGICFFIYGALLE